MLLMGLSDFVTDTDPCTLNPGDPVCQAFGPAGPQDPCEQDPNQSFCQAAIRGQHIDPNIVMDPTTLNPTNVSSGAAASLSNIGLSWPIALLLAVVGGGAYWLYRVDKRARARA